MRGSATLAALACAVAGIALLAGAGGSAATTPPTATLVGDLQHLAGCGGDWDPACTATDLADPGDGIDRIALALPAGDYQYKVAIGHSWDENYGADASPGGDNIALHLAAPATVHFYYDPATHWITDDVGSTIVTAAGDFQSELGCSGDWQPSCLKSWLEAPHGGVVYTFATEAIPPGSYQWKAALREGWDESYPGSNLSFTVPPGGAKVTFTFDASTHTPSVSVVGANGSDNDIHWNELGFDSRSTLYRTPQGAVPAGTPVLLRFRTLHDDVTSVDVRLWDVNRSAQSFLPMTRVASGAPCLDGEKCDYWQASVPTPEPDVYWYRFVVHDGSAVAYYGDNDALDGGVGVTTSSLVDNSYALTVYDPSFTVPAWASHAVVYQIFPDRFANGDRKNDPKPTDVLYDTHPTLKAWNDRPEGYCRSYVGGCPDGAGPHGTDYFGGDLKGIRQKLEWIHENGFDTIYLNPIFWAKSNHRYDTADYLQIDPYLGDMKEFTLLVQQAHELGMHIILDGVFNHMSSDSPFFDRYHHYATSGACESPTSQWYGWFTFTDAAGPCGGHGYTGWGGFDSIPVLTKSDPAVQSYFLTGDDSVAKHWLRAGADGWRLDVMSDPSFPPGYWETFRRVVKQTDPDALIVGEMWQKDSTLLRLLDGSAADSTMNYRLRDALLGLLLPAGGHFDGKGFPDSGHGLTPTQFAARMEAQQEDYAPQVYSDLMNLVDSHDTARALWDLTPGAATTADKELNAANVAEGEQRLRLAALVQYTLPGMPTVYYGDEVGVTGGDDPDNRRTYPWPNTGGKQDAALLSWYRQLGVERRSQPELVDGGFRMLLADDANGTVAFGRKDAARAAVVALNTGTSTRTLTIPVAGYLPDGTALASLSGGSATVSGGSLSVTLPPLGGTVLASGPVDLVPPAVPSGLALGDVGPGSVALHWAAVEGAASYAVYRSPLTHGGYVRVGTTGGTGFTDTTVPNGLRWYYVVRALDAAGNESGDSNEVMAAPALPVVWANVQWPPSIDEPLRAAGWTVYGQAYVPGITDSPSGSPEQVRAQLGWGTSNDRTTWHWVDAALNPNCSCGNNYEYMATFQPDAPGAYDYGYRYSTNDGVTWTDADTSGLGTASPGVAQIAAPADTTPPAAPTGLHTVSASPSEIDLAWDAGAESDLFGYEVDRASGGSAFAKVGGSSTASFADTTVTAGTTYTYVVRAVDTSANVSDPSDPVTATAAVRHVHVVFTVTVPAATPSGWTVHVAGSFGDLDPSYPTWDPTGLPMTQVDATHWTIAVDGLEGQSLQYKYALGSWDYVEKDATCGEIGNRTLTLAYGPGGVDAVADTVLNWRNLNGCPS